jgi:hypothetical protein
MLTSGLLSPVTDTPFSLDEHLIEQPRVTSEREIFSQTDAFTRYVTPKKAIATADGEFHRPKVGVDSGTQVQIDRRLFYSRSDSF